MLICQTYHLLYICNCCCMSPDYSIYSNIVVYTTVRIACQQFKRIWMFVQNEIIFDAFGGPFKDKYHSWPGLLLIIRLILLLLTSFNNNTSISTASIIICVLFIVSLIANFRGIYQKWYNNLIETFLGLLCAMSAYADNK